MEHNYYGIKSVANLSNFLKELSHVLMTLPTQPITLLWSPKMAGFRSNIFHSNHLNFQMSDDCHRRYDYCLFFCKI